MFKTNNGCFLQNPATHPHSQLGSCGGNGSRRRRKKSRSLSGKQNTVTIGLPMFGSNGAAAASAASMAGSSVGSSQQVCTKKRNRAQMTANALLKSVTTYFPPLRISEQVPSRALKG